MSKRSYNQHLRHEDPLSAMPRTSKWRLLRSLRQQNQLQNDETSSTFNDTVPPPTVADTHDDSGSYQEDTWCTSEHEAGMEHSDSDGGDELQEPDDRSSSNHSQSSSDHEDGTFDDILDSLQGEEEAPSEWLQGAVDFTETDHATNANQDISDDEDEDELEWFDCNDEFSTPIGNSEDSPLFKGATITLVESLTLILIFAMKHQLTGVCLQDLLHLISLHCISPNICVTSLYMFQKFFASLRSPLVFHKFCNSCEVLLSHESISSGNCPRCSNSLVSEDGISFFIEIPMVAQLQKFFKTEGFFSDLQHRFKHEEKNNTNIEDVYDGEEYKRHFGPGGFLRNPNNISLFWYVDGVPLFKSTKRSLWPLYFSINELPYGKRIRKENMLFAGLWFGSKPSMSTFLKPFSSALKDMRDGFEVQLPNSNSPITVKCLVLGGTCDLPAKAMVLNMMQYNGRFGCARCKQEGKVVNVGSGHTRVYPYSKEDPGGPTRSHTETLQNAREAFHTKVPVNGIKGPSWFMYLGADIIRGTAIDYMHEVLLGLVRKLLSLWCSSTYSSELFSLSQFVNIIDERLKSIKPPNFITRVPRSISDHIKYWKASECRSWLLYYSVPVLSGLMEDIYFSHYLLLVESIYLLNSTSISSDMLAHCDLLLKEYVCLFPVLYGEQMMSMNLHLLLHLPQAVRDLGPLWAQSCFHFEGVNGSLLKFFHGTQKPEVQIANTIGTMLSIPALIKNLKTERAKTFYNDYLSPKSSASKREPVNEDVWVLGAPIQIILPQNVVALLSNFHTEMQNITFSMYARVLHNHTVIQSKAWTIVKKRNSFTIGYNAPNSNEVQFGQINYFVKSSMPEVRCFAVVKPLRKLPCPFKFKHFQVVNAVKSTVDEECVVIPVCQITSLCVYVPDSDSQDNAYVILPPNTQESD